MFHLSTCVDFFPDSDKTSGCLFKPEATAWSEKRLDGFVSYKFWRHPFTADDPVVSKWCNAKFLQICSHEETNSSTFCMAWVHFQQIFILGELFHIII